jgi:hypothetical protein
MAACAKLEGRANNYTRIMRRLEEKKKGIKR